MLRPTDLYSYSKKLIHRSQKSEMIDIPLSSNYIITYMEFIKSAQIDSKKSTYPSLIGIMYDVLGITSVGQIW